MPDFEKGKRPSAKALNRIAHGINRVASMVDGNHVGVQVNESGVHLSHKGRTEFFAKITGGTGPYSWSEAVRSGTTWTAPTGYRSGTLNAYEVNGQSVATGKVVKLSQEVPGEYVFRLNHHKPPCTAKMVCIYVDLCCSINPAGISVVITQGATTVATLTTAATTTDYGYTGTGIACISLSPGTYAASITSPVVASKTFTMTCSNQAVYMGIIGITVHAQVCCNDATAGTTIVVKDGGGTTIASGTTVAGTPPGYGEFCCMLPAVGTYTVVASRSGYTTNTSSHSLGGGCNDVYVGMDNCFSGTVYGCSGCPVSGATIVVTTTTGTCTATSTVIVPGSIDSDNWCCHCSGTFVSATFSATGYVTETVGIGLGIDYTSVSLSPDSSHACCPVQCCLYPKVLNATIWGVSVTLNWDGFYPGWVGCGSVNVAGLTYSGTYPVNTAPPYVLTRTTVTIPFGVLLTCSGQVTIYYPGNCTFFDLNVSAWFYSNFPSLYNGYCEETALPHTITNTGPFNWDGATAPSCYAAPNLGCYSTEFQGDISGGNYAYQLPPFSVTMPTCTTASTPTIYLTGSTSVTFHTDYDPSWDTVVTIGAVITS